MPTPLASRFVHLEIKVASEFVAMHAMIVDAANDGAIRFYEGVRLHAPGEPAEAVVPPARTCRSARPGGIETIMCCIRRSCSQPSRMSAAMLSETRTADSRTESSARCAYLAVVSTCV